jgi:hypothetical protein
MDQAAMLIKASPRAQSITPEIPFISKNFHELTAIRKQYIAAQGNNGCPIYSLSHHHDFRPCVLTLKS